MDEAPLETSWISQLKLLPISILLNMDKPLIVGYVKLLAFYIVSFTSCLIFSNYIESYVPLKFWLFNLFGSIQWIRMSALERCCNISKTTDILKSIAEQLNDSFSYLWIALQSNFLNDFGYGVQITRKDVEDCRKMLFAEDTYHCPILRHNLRNSEPISDIKFVTWDGAGSARSVDIASIPKAPPSLSPTPTNESLYIPLSSISKLKLAVSYAYNHEAFGKPKVLVVILDDKKMLPDVVAGLSQTGLDVVTYFKPEDRDKCENFLRNPKGALVTSGILFSGMEAASAIWVRGANPLFFNSNTRRVIDKICIICTDLRQVGKAWGYGLKVDPTFAQCSLPWPSILSKCNLSQCKGRPVCNSCQQVCHVSAGHEHGNHGIEWDWVQTVLHWVLPFTNQCSCDALGECKLTGQTFLDQTRSMDVWFFALFTILLSILCYSYSV